MARKKKINGKIRIIPLGGLSEIGKNMTVIEYNDEIIVVDCGLGFPDDDMLGIDLVIPDVSYLVNKQDKIKGIFLTHGHEDHIGALPFVLKELHVPVYGTKLTLGILANKLTEHKYEIQPELVCVKAGDVVESGSFKVEFIHVNHSIADACALAITTPLGVLVHSGDFKVDYTPVDGEVTDLSRLGAIGKKGVLLLMCESTNAEREGYSPSEKNVGKSLDNIFMRHKDKRIVIATFSSNVHRVQQIIDASAQYGRKVAVTGRSMLNIVSAAMELGYMKVPKGTIIDITEMKKYPPEKLTIISTGSQGEPMSALYRMAYAEHDRVQLGVNDLVVISAHAIPGNEKLVDNIINELCRKGIAVFRDQSVSVHVSGHACAEELKLMHALVRPRYFMPVHGEYKHLYAHKELACSMGMPANHVFVSDIGKVLEIDGKGIRFNGAEQAGKVLVDGLGVGDVGNIVLRDRKHLSEDGLIVVVATVDTNTYQIASGPDVVSRGFVYVRENEELMEELRAISAEEIDKCLTRGKVEWNQMKNAVRDELSKCIYQKTKRRPMILPVIMNI
ncbi:MAG: ribonuclease J [Clostridiales bacterium]|nr:ribonuclease J [Clostridiales bacterium]